MSTKRAAKLPIVHDTEERHTSSKVQQTNALRLKIDHLKSNCQKVWISYPHCNPIFQNRSQTVWQLRLRPPDSNHLTHTVRYSDESGIQVLGIQMVTVLPVNKNSPIKYSGDQNARLFGYSDGQLAKMKLNMSDIQTLFLQISDHSITYWRHTLDVKIQKSG